MKKSVAILVAAVGLLSIAMVAFLGTKPAGISPFIYISQVEILDNESHSIEAKVDPWGFYGRQLTISFSPDVTDATTATEYMYYVFDTKITPSNASSRSFLYYAANDSYVSFVESPIKKEEDSSSSSASSSGSAASSVPESAGQSNTTGKMVIKRQKDDTHKEHLITICCKANDGGPAGIEDKLDVLIQFPEAGK
jgi:hypothetical protein